MAYPSYSLKSNQPKPIGEYLVEAGLVSEAQVGVVLADQTVTPLPFGEILVTRGWVKEQTIEYLMEKVILPERQTQSQSQSALQQGLIRQGSPSQRGWGTPSPRKAPVAPKQPVKTEPKQPPTVSEPIRWIG